MQIHELGRVGLFVKSLQRSAHFYRDVLGFRALETPERMRGRVMAFSTGRTHHELLLTLSCWPMSKGIPPRRSPGSCRCRSAR
jgi:catechol 2,3-dioxygenase-like lactoylglutathione lyase family enzyme